MASRKLGMARRIQENKLKRQRKLRRNQVDRPLAKHPLASPRAFIESGGMEKMSEVLDRFVQPFMRLATTEASARSVYAYGVAAWNASFFSVDKQKETIDKIIREARIPDEEQIAVRSLLHDMIERKKAYFATDGRVILNYVLADTGDGFDLTVMALLPKVRPS